MYRPLLAGPGTEIGVLQRGAKKQAGHLVDQNQTRRETEQGAPERHQSKGSENTTSNSLTSDAFDFHPDLELLLFT